MSSIKQGVVNIRGKEYQTVALRVHKFREEHPDWGIETEIIGLSDDHVVVKATIRNEQGRIIGTGHAEENRKSSQINKTSALENAETSGLGRALASLGYGGEEYASANEVTNAIHQQSAGHTSAPPKQKPRDPDARLSADTVDVLREAFHAQGTSDEQIEKYCGKRITELTERDRDTLRHWLKDMRTQAAS